MTFGATDALVVVDLHRQLTEPGRRFAVDGASRGTASP